MLKFNVENEFYWIMTRGDKLLIYEGMKIELLLIFDGNGNGYDDFTFDFFDAWGMIHEVDGSLSKLTFYLQKVSGLLNTL